MYVGWADGKVMQWEALVMAQTMALTPVIEYLHECIWPDAADLPSSSHFVPGGDTWRGA